MIRRPGVWCPGDCRMGGLRPCCRGWVQDRKIIKDVHDACAERHTITCLVMIERAFCGREFRGMAVDDFYSRTVVWDCESRCVGGEGDRQ